MTKSDKLKKLQEITNLSYQLYTDSMRLSIAIENGYNYVANDYAKTFSDSSIDLMQLMLSILKPSGFTVEEKKPMTEKQFLDAACAEATAAGQNWE